MLFLWLWQVKEAKKLFLAEETRQGKKEKAILIIAGFW